MIEVHTAGTTRLTVCIGRYALKIARGRRGCIANYAERVERERATPERRKMLCPLLRAAPFHPAAPKCRVPTRHGRNGHLTRHAHAQS
jgi:hypothetical protein